MPQTLYLLSAPRIAGLLPANIPSSAKAPMRKMPANYAYKSPGQIQNELWDVACQLMEVAFAIVGGPQSNLEFLRAETTFIEKIQILRAGASSSIPYNSHSKSGRRLPTPDEIDLDIKTTFQRCHDRFQDTKNLSSEMMKGLMV